MQSKDLITDRKTEQTKITNRTTSIRSGIEEDSKIVNYDQIYT